MSTFKNIQGKNIRSYANNAPNATAGEMWYNRTEQKLKGVVASESMSSASPLVYTNFSGGTFGTQTAAVIGGGYSPTTNPPGAGTAKQQTQEYNGSAWSLGGNLNTGRGHLFGFGVETAGVVSGGYTTTNLANTEEYNGSSWTAGNSMGTARRGMEGAGVETAGLVFGGYVGPAGSTATEEYDGTNWTSGGALTTSNPINYYNAGTGTQTAGLRMGGQGTNVSEEYNGSSWTAGNNMNSPRAYGGSFGAQTSALIGGGSNPPTTYLTAVEKYDGTSFSVSPATLSSPRAITGQAAGGISGNTAGVFAGGYSPVDSPAGDTGNTITEEYNFSANVITAGAWASGGALGTARTNLTGCGTQTAGLGFGGETGPGTARDETEEYNGSSWSEQSDLNTARFNLAGCGTQTAGLAFGGSSPSAKVNNSEEYNGSSWTASPGNLNTTRDQMGGAGIQTAGLAFGGQLPPNAMSNATEEYNGSTWTSVNNMGTGRRLMGSGGIQTSAFGAGGYVDGSGNQTATEEYDGTNWTAGGALILARHALAGAGASNTAGLVFGGNSITGATEGYDGTNWSTRPSMATARFRLGGLGIQTSALAFGGSSPSIVATTEEFTGETTAANIEDITTS